MWSGTNFRDRVVERHHRDLVSPCSCCRDPSGLESAQDSGKAVVGELARLVDLTGQPLESTDDARAHDEDLRGFLDQTRDAGRHVHGVRDVLPHHDEKSHGVPLCRTFRAGENPTGDRAEDGAATVAQRGGGWVPVTSGGRSTQCPYAVPESSRRQHGNVKLELMRIAVTGWSPRLDDPGAVVRRLYRRADNRR